MSAHDRDLDVTYKEPLFEYQQRPGFTRFSDDGTSNLDPMSHYSYPLNDDRQQMLDRLDEETDANTRADAIDAAIRHYLEDKQNREKHWERFPPELLKLLNTSEMKVSYYQKVR